jgi:hypothetical protein
LVGPDHHEEAVVGVVVVIVIVVDGHDIEEAFALVATGQGFVVVEAEPQSMTFCHLTVRRLNRCWETTDEAPEAGVMVGGVKEGAFRGRARGAAFVASVLLVSEITASHHSYARPRDMAISMSYRFWSSTSIFNGSRRPVV